MKCWNKDRHFLLALFVKDRAQIKFSTSIPVSSSCLKSVVPSLPVVFLSIILVAYLARLCAVLCVFGAHVSLTKGFALHVLNKPETTVKERHKGLSQKSLMEFSKEGIDFAGPEKHSSCGCYQLSSMWCFQHLWDICFV